MRNLKKFEISKNKQKNVKGGAAPVCDWENGLVACRLPSGKWECLFKDQCDNL